MTPCAGLNNEERGALGRGDPDGVSARGVVQLRPPRAEGRCVLVASYVPVLDPTYLVDFWSQPGYLGTSPTSSVEWHRIQHETTVVEVIPGRRKQFGLYRASPAVISPVLT